MHTLATDRLTLRRWRTEDAVAALDIYSRWGVARYLGAQPKVMEDLVEARTRVERWSALDHPVHGVWAITLTADPSDTPVGTALLKELPASGDTEPLPPSGDVEVGWHLHPDHWGRGYATEAAARMLQHGFEGGLTKILAVTHPENGTSQAVCQRLGMEHLGVTDRYYNVPSELFRAVAG